MSGWTSERRALDAVRLFSTLHEHGVNYVVVGGLAAIAHGYSETTRDADAVPAYDVANLDRLASALEDLDAVLYAFPERTDLRPDGSPPELDGFELTGKHLRTNRVWQFMTDAGPLDVLLVPSERREAGIPPSSERGPSGPVAKPRRADSIDGPGGYDVLIRNAEPRTVGNFEVMVASLDDLIEAKETAGRDKDLRALGELRRIRDRRDRA